MSICGAGISRSWSAATGGSRCSELARGTRLCSPFLDEWAFRRCSRSGLGSIQCLRRVEGGVPPKRKNGNGSSSPLGCVPERLHLLKWEEFLADLEHNPDPAQTWRTIKALSGFPASTAFSEPLVHNGRTFTTNQGKANAFMKAYAAVNRLNFSRTERSRIRQLKQVLRSPTVGEACCQPFQSSERDRSIRQ